MLFISRHANYKAVLAPEVVDMVETARGRMREKVTRQPLMAEFDSRWFMVDEPTIEEALRRFSMTTNDLVRNAPIGERTDGLTVADNGVAVPTSADDPRRRLSWFDTNVHVADARLREEYEELLLNSPENGMSYIQIDPYVTPAPWPAYDDQDAEEILSFMDQGGFDPQVILAYEVKHENRSEIVDVLTAKLGLAQNTAADLGALSTVVR